MDAQALRMVASSVSEANGGWPDGRGLWTVMVGADNAAEESKPSLSLRLGIGGTDESARDSERERPVELTRAQLSELYHQSLVYKYLAARLPVPPHLLLPFRKSESTSYPPPVDVSLQKHHSTSIGFRKEALDYMNRMSPDPERCRRTDGKKWRCSKNVVPHQKYCERHVNRGQQRSRKPLEISKTASPSKTRTTCETTNDDLGHAKADITLGLRLNSGVSSEVNSENKSSLNVKDRYGTSVTIVSGSSSSRTSLSSPGIYKGRSYVDYQQNLPKNGVGTNNDVIRRNVFPALGFSPKSVLQVMGHANTSWPNCKEAEPVPEPWRCRRTDGKKWRCSRDVLPDQKYCDRHIHRGSKRLSQARRFGASAINGSPLNTPMTAQGSSPADLNTRFAISTPAASQRFEKRSSTSSSSESDTTLSDTTIAAYE